MPNAASLASVSQGLLIQNVDGQRAAGDNFTLPTFLRTEFDAGHTALDAADNDTVLTESDRTGGSQAAREAIDTAAQLLRDGFHGIKGLPSTEIKKGEKLEVFTAYGWSGGKLGKLGDARVIGLARLGVQNHPEVKKEWRYSAAIVTGLTEQLAIYDGNVDNSKLGSREAATKKRDKALEAFKVLLARVRFYYCCASPMPTRRRNWRRSDSNRAEIPEPWRSQQLLRRRGRRWTSSLVSLVKIFCSESQHKKQGTA